MRTLKEALLGVSVVGENLDSVVEDEGPINNIFLGILIT